MKYKLLLIFSFILVISLAIYFYLKYENIKQNTEFYINAYDNYCHRLEALIYNTNTEKKEIRLPRFLIDKNIKEFTDYISKKEKYKLVNDSLFKSSHTEEKNKDYLLNANNIVNFSKYFNEEKEEGSVIYVGRKDSKRRKILNEEVLIEFLKEKYKDKLKILDLSKGYSMLDQAKIFSKCDIFIGIHGAAIANLYFMKPESRIIQILAYDCKPHYFDRKANNRKIRHDFLHLKDFKHSDDVHNFPRDSYMTIHDKDIKQLNRLLDQ